MEQIGKYHILKRLGGGGFGEVFLGEDVSINRQVAIKVFHPKDENLIAFATSSTEEGLASLRERFVNEAKILATLEHEDSIINIIEFGEMPDGSPWYAMPYVPHSLAEKLGKDIFDKRAIEELAETDHPKALPLTEALDYLEQILQGLAASHQHGLVHRDIKPANILLTSHGRVRIADFGIAKAPDGGNSTVSHLGMGSRNYMAPEQRESAKHVDARADVYSLGIFAYRMLTGRLPSGRFSDPNVLVPELCQALNDVILKAMSEDTDLRYIDAEQMLAAFRQAKQNQGQNQQNNLNQETVTWVGGEATQIKAELKPLETKIIELLQKQGEVRASDKVYLQALADIADVDEDGLSQLITQVTEQQQTSSAEQKALIQWTSGINKRLNTSQGQLDESYIESAVSAGTSTTGKTQTQLKELLAEKNADQGNDNEITESAIVALMRASQTTEQISEKTQSGLPKVAFIIVLLLIISCGGYYGFTYYQAGLLKAQQMAVAKKNEQSAWNQAKNLNTIAGYQLYLTNWQTGQNVSQAKAKQSQLTEQARLAQLSKQEERTEQISQAQQLLIQLDYQISKTGKVDTRTKKAIEAYESSEGLLVTGVVDEVLLTNLHQSYSQKDNAAWNKAQKAHHIESYQAYQTNKPQGQYLNQAKEAVDELVLQAKKQQALEASKVALTINITPRDAKVTLLNIKEGYQEGVKLLPGEYQIKINRTGYHPQSDTIILSKNQQKFSYSLNRDLPPAIETLINELIVIPKGSFQMGCVSDEICNSDEKQVHRVKSPPFKVMATEVTFAMWDACVEEKGCQHKPDDNNWGRGHHPVINVSYSDITEQFVPWLTNTTGNTFRLPSEAEWEYAARAGSTTKYSWGNTIGNSKANCDGCGSQWDNKKTAPIKIFKPNQFGLYDMHGNVWEWTQDCWNNSYQGAPSNGSSWLKGNCDRRVLRGGSWNDGPNYLRSAIRHSGYRTFRYNTYGFRLVQSD